MYLMFLNTIWKKKLIFNFVVFLGGGNSSPGFITRYLPLATKSLIGILHTVYAFLNLAFFTLFPDEKSLKNKVILVSI